MRYLLSTFAMGFGYGAGYAVASKLLNKILNRKKDWSYTAPWPWADEETVVDED